MVLEILGLSHQYGFVDLENAVSDYLKQTLTAKNCCIIYDSARLYNLKFLMQVSAAFIDNNVTSIIAHESFSQLSLVSISFKCTFSGSFEKTIYQIAGKL